MTILTDYHHFDGRHHDTGPIRNILAYQGAPAPHTGKPLSEAMLLGISGGITVGYFTFAYQGLDPHLALLTRNTFDPVETIFERLALPREVLQTSKPDTAQQNLIKVLENGQPALVWADAYSLSYNQMPFADKMWMMLPLVVYGVEDETAYLADRSNQPLCVPLSELTQARGRIKEDKYRIITLDAPNMEKLASAVQKGIWQCISLYTDMPPKGKRDNFGFAALENWANLLVNTRNKQSWERFFPAGCSMYVALAGNRIQPGAFDWICTWSGAGSAERGSYADFLDEAALLLNKPDLSHAAAQFRQAGAAWDAFANALLPDSVPVFKETRDLKLRRHHLFIEQGSAAREEIAACNLRLGEIVDAMRDQFPLSAAEAATFREALRDHVLNILAIEREAVSMLSEAIS